jgi:hypothetical protein
MKTNHWSGKKAVKVVKDGRDMLSGGPFTPTKDLFKGILGKHYKNHFSGEWASEFVCPARVMIEEYIGRQEDQSSTHVALPFDFKVGSMTGSMNSTLVGFKVWVGPRAYECTFL